MKPRIKICCISSLDEAARAVAAGAAAVGLVGPMPSGPGVIADELIAEIAAAVPPPVATFLLTSEQTAAAVVAHARRVRTNTVQLVDALEDRAFHELRAALPGVKLVPVVHVAGEEAVDEACALAALADAVLLDSGNPKLAVKELGGTGRVHNWNLSRRIVETCGKPVFLAGGIGPHNVREAFEKVGPFGFDLCSSVRTNGRLDPAKLDAFFEEVGKI